MSGKYFLQNLHNLLAKNLAGNDVLHYFIALAAFSASFLLISVLARFVINQFKKFTARTRFKWNGMFAEIIKKNLLWINLLISLYVGLHFITVLPHIQKITGALLVILITLITLRVLQGFIKYWFEVHYFKRPDQDVATLSIMKNMLLFVRVGLWVGGALFVLDNLGFNITTAVAGLGIGGMAVALAGQNILSDVFSYFTIFFDKPFEVGDYIVVGDQMGTVDHIGIKTTRVRSLNGEQLVFGNSDLIKSCIRNFKKMDSRRMCVEIGVTYETPLPKLKKIPGIIRGILEATENITADRVYFKAFGDFSLNFEYVYFVNSREYNDYVQAHQHINYRLFEAFAGEGIDFAYPTQTLHFKRIPTA